jgi:hypothetical protein
MPRVPFEVLPDRGRLWVFPASRRLAGGEGSQLLSGVDEFLDVWAAHGRPLTSGRLWVDERFLLIGVDVDLEPPSGCSIDALFHRISASAAALGIALHDHSGVLYRDGHGVRGVSRDAFRALAEDGEVGPETVVFDTTLTRIGDYRVRGLEGPAVGSWHGRAFFRARLHG